MQPEPQRKPCNLHCAKQILRFQHLGAHCAASRILRAHFWRVRACARVRPSGQRPAGENHAAEPIPLLAPRASVDPRLHEHVGKLSTCASSLCAEGRPMPPRPTYRDDAGKKRKKDAREGACKLSPIRCPQHLPGGRKRRKKKPFVVPTLPPVRKL